ncbi:hypothetical protein JXA85_02035 [Candidatus Woesearchaeota archaeon]|nr:hypothetical protein [Candidatus Woesearchaeota archaeon]
MNASINISVSELSSITLNDYVLSIKPLAITIIGIAIYSVIVFKFYRFISRRDVIKLNTGYADSVGAFFKNIVLGLAYILQNLIIIPLFVLFWSGILMMILAFISKETSADRVVLTAVALVGAIRICAYYTENLSQDLAKMLPFAILGIYLVDVSYFSVERSLLVLKQLPSLVVILLKYLLFIILLEFLLRMLRAVQLLIFGDRNQQPDG